MARAAFLKNRWPRYLPFRRQRAIAEERMKDLEFSLDTGAYLRTLGESFYVNTICETLIIPRIFWKWWKCCSTYGSQTDLQKYPRNAFQQSTAWWELGHNHQVSCGSAHMLTRTTLPNVSSKCTQLFNKLHTCISNKLSNVSVSRRNSLTIRSASAT